MKIKKFYLIKISKKINRIAIKMNKTFKKILKAKNLSCSNNIENNFNNFKMSLKTKNNFMCSHF
jgi:hypothetical protein